MGRNRKKAQVATKKYKEKQYDLLLCTTGCGRPVVGLNAYCELHRDNRNKRMIYHRQFMGDFK